MGDYATIHVTPEPEFSYVSFETNIATGNYMDLVTKVVDTFKPSKLIVTFYATRVIKLFTRIRLHIKSIISRTQKQLNFMKK